MAAVSDRRRAARTSAGFSLAPKRRGFADRLIRRRLSVPLTLFLLLPTIVVYSISWNAPLVLDSVRTVEASADTLSQFLEQPFSYGGSRPIGDLSFALNYSLHGPSPAGYRIVNLVLHLLCTTLFFLITREALQSDRVGYTAPVASKLAYAAAAIWSIHPLQTSAITYVCQRYETLMGLFLLLTLFTFQRAQHARRQWPLLVCSIIFGFCGMATKQIMIAAPLLVMWYDRVFIAESWKQLFAQRLAYYLGLGSIWILLGWQIMRQLPSYESAGVLIVENVTPVHYALSQSGVLLHYLRLCLLPTRQCLDYGWPLATTWTSFVPQTLAIFVLLALWGGSLFKRPAIGFLGAWFFLILAPTSSIAPLRDLAFEHRMYLPSMSAVVLAVISAHHLAARFLGSTRPEQNRRWAPVTLVAVMVCFGALTIRRNLLFNSPIQLWAENVAAAPHHWRAHFNLSVLLMKENPTLARSQLQETLRLKPTFPDAWVNLGILQLEAEQFDEAFESFARAIELAPNDPAPYGLIGRAYAELGETEKAFAYYQKTLEIDPADGATNNNLGYLLNSLGRPEEALSYLRTATRSPEFASEAWTNLGMAYQRLGRDADSMRSLLKAIELDSDSYIAYYNVGRLSHASRPDQAERYYAETLRLQPDFSPAHNNLAALLEHRQPKRALYHYQRATEAAPDNANAFANLAELQARLGRQTDAIENYRRALSLEPNHVRAKAGLESLTSDPSDW